MAEETTKRYPCSTGYAYDVLEVGTVLGDNYDLYFNITTPESDTVVMLSTSQVAALMTQLQEHITK